MRVAQFHSCNAPGSIEGSVSNPKFAKNGSLAIHCALIVVQPYAYESPSYILSDFSSKEESMPHSAKLKEENDSISFCSAFSPSLWAIRVQMLPLAKETRMLILILCDRVGINTKQAHEMTF